MSGGWLTRVAARVPSRCALCGAWPAQAVCSTCIARFAMPRARCTRCALPVPASVDVCGACIRVEPPLDRCLAAVDYAYPWSGLVTRYKFGGEPGWSAALARLLARAPGLEDELAHADFVIPLPLSRERLASRGFNQALQIARGLAPAKLRTNWLLRIRDTAPQTALGKRQRVANVRGAFAVEPLQAHRLAGRKVLLIDDVMTSGASLHAAALALKSAGASQVAAAVVARTSEPE